MGGSKARAVSAKGAGDYGKETAQDQTSDSDAATKAADTVSSSLASDVSPATLRGMPSPLRRARMSGLTAQGRMTLLNLITQDTALLDDLFPATPDAEVSTLRYILQLRFHKNFATKGKDVAWDAGGMRRMYAVLADLPVEHVGGNDKMDDVVKYADSDNRYVHGYYQDGGNSGPSSKHDTLGFSYGADQLQTGVHGEYVEATDGLTGINEFDSAARHEVGHAVDAKFGYTDKHMTESMFGGWKEYGSARAWVSEMYDHSAPLMVSPAYRASMLDAIVYAVETDPSTNANGAVDATAVANRFLSVVHDTLLKNAGQLLTAGLGGPAISPAMLSSVEENLIKHIGSVMTGAKPWNGHDGGGALGGRVYEESYKGQYMSYDVSTRDPSKRCSLYQFRAQGEFFAESYSLYYSPVKPGEIRGSLLADRNKPLFDWMQKNFEKPQPKAPTSPPAKTGPH